MNKCLQELKDRGFFQQSTDEEALSKMLNEGPVVFYAGFDPTNVSLHVGHLVPIMAMSHLQMYGHKPIALIGGGTSMIGDPTGKTESRKILTIKQIDDNSKKIKKQLENFVILDGEKGILLNNADWLRGLNYIEFLRDIGKHFSVNRMLTFETYKERMKSGLSFLEFNYLLLQSYDFLHLYDNYNCKLQIGGDDQWANMVSGVDLVRRVKQARDVECLTFPLTLTSDGKKMGKTEKGAIFLSEELTTAYECYQYWVNVTDQDVIKFLKLYTFLPLDEIKKYEHLKAEELNPIKKILAYEVTKNIFGIEKAKKAKDGADAAFGNGANLNEMPSTTITKNRITEGIPIVDLYVEVSLANSKSEVKRLIKQGGCRVNDTKITDEKTIINEDYIIDKGIILKSGKKKIHLVKII